MKIDPTDPKYFGKRVRYNGDGVSMYYIFSRVTSSHLYGQVFYADREGSARQFELRDSHWIHLKEIGYWELIDIEKHVCRLVCDCNPRESMLI